MEGTDLGRDEVDFMTDGTEGERDEVDLMAGENVLRAVL